MFGKLDYQVFFRFGIVEDEVANVNRYNGLWGRYFGFGLSAQLFVADPDLLREILVEKSSLFIDNICGRSMPDK